ncbi:MAG: glycosyl hydrolase, partial [Candidatus Binatia bacterium]
SDTLFGVAAVDGSTAWAVGDLGLILATTDGGTNWNEQSSNVSDPIYGVTFVNADFGWAVSDRGGIIATQTGGQ